MHIRSKEDIEERKIKALDIFNKIISHNFKKYEAQANKLLELNLLEEGKYKYNIGLQLTDTRKFFNTSPSDIIITSPPYGDNTTTVPYGQYSYLPLQWIDLTDIEVGIDKHLLESVYKIDRLSLGGSRKILDSEKEIIVEKSSSFQSYIKKLRDQPVDRLHRVTAFFRDLDACIEPILNNLSPGGLMFWILGNRKVGGMEGSP